MKKVFFIWTAIFMLSGVCFAQKNWSPSTKISFLNMNCPVKGEFNLKYKKVGGAAIDREGSIYSGDGRYCQKYEDWDICRSINPTPKTPCKLVNPLIPRGVLSEYCPMTYNGFIDLDKDKTILGGWLGADIKRSIYFNAYQCSRAYALDSCRYWFQNTALTSFTNQGLFSVDKILTGNVSVCGIDQQAQTAYQEKLKKNFVVLEGLLNVKKEIWEKKCLASNAACKNAVNGIWVQSKLFAAANMDKYPNDGNPFEVMKAVTKNYDPTIEAEIAKYPKSSQFPNPK